MKIAVSAEDQPVVVLVGVVVWQGVALLLGISTWWGYLFPMLLGVIYAYGYGAWQSVQNMSNAMAKRELVVQVSRKSMPSTY